MKQKFWSGITTTAFVTILGTTAFLSTSLSKAEASTIDASTDEQSVQKTEKKTIENWLDDRAFSVTTFLDSPAEKQKPSKTAVEETGLKQMRGIASWYGPGFHGRQTANGERFNQNDLTAAHRSLPFGTRVRVTNTNNGRSVVVRINDRGPFSGGRVIDLSSAAAAAIGLKSSGVGPVSIEVLGR
jgi:rare lipoprotein A